MKVAKPVRERAEGFRVGAVDIVRIATLPIGSDHRPAGRRCSAAAARGTEVGQLLDRPGLAARRRPARLDGVAGRARAQEWRDDQQIRPAVDTARDRARLLVAQISQRHVVVTFCRQPALTLLCPWRTSRWLRVAQLHPLLRVDVAFSPIANDHHLLNGNGPSGSFLPAISSTRSFGMSTPAAVVNGKVPGKRGLTSSNLKTPSAARLNCTFAT